MLTNGLPTDLNFSMPANKAMVLEVAVELPNASGDELLGYTFAGEVTGADGTTYAIEGAVSDSAQNLVRLHLPSLAEGTYKYALAATGQSGESEAFLAGTIGVWWAAIGEQTEPIETPNSRCIVRLPEVGRGMAHWQLTGRLEAAAIEAEWQAFLASEWAQAAEEAAKSVTGGALAQQLGEVNAALKNFYDKVGNSIQANKVTNTWWVAGVDTGEQVTGDKGPMGFSPYISATGTWIAWDEQSQKAVDTHTRAQGRDGIDGSAIRRVLVTELPDLPTNSAEAAAHRGIFYLISAPDGYDVYALMETLGGAFAWVNVGDSNALASATLYGLSKLGTDATVSGAPVGTNASGGLEVPAATTVNAGVVIKSRSLADRYDTNVPTVESVRAFLDQYFYEKTPIDTRFSGVNTAIENARNDVTSLTNSNAKLSTDIEALKSSIKAIEAALNTRPTKSEVDDAINSAYEHVVDAVKDELVSQLSAEDYAAITPKEGVIYLIPEE